MKFNIGIKIIGGYILAILILVIIGMTSYRNIGHLIDNSNMVSHTNQVMAEAFSLESAMKEAETGQRGFLLTGEQSYLEPYNRSLDSIYYRINTIRDLTLDNPNQTARIDNLKLLADQKLEELAKTISLRRNEGFEAAMVIVISNQGKQIMDDFTKLISEMIEEEKVLLNIRTNDSEMSANRSKLTISLGIPIAVIVLGLIGWIISRNITIPLGEATKTAILISQGEITTSTNKYENRKDEVGVLLKTFRSMTEYLEEMAAAAKEVALGNLAKNIHPRSDKDRMGNSFVAMQKSLKIKEKHAQEIAKGNLNLEIELLSEDDSMGKAFKTMLENLKHQLNEITEGVGVLASSSSEIMASVTQLATGSSETATSVGETTITVEEVKQTAEVSNLKAKAVSENAARTKEISSEGTRAIANTIEGMNKIRQQMTSIASMVVKLSEQSQTIGEITASVNELAEQSNLLAVNAAIEAAKAGEKGKGFTVVAQEIKMLADRSKEATAQVRTILRDVQKSISSAVMATEEGGKAVDEGLKLTTKSGETIKTLSESVSEAASAAIQIAASSQQQLEGMDQIVSAMENIKEASIQAAASTQQSVDSVQELQKVGQKLDELMKMYKLK
jgi:methyl-accepting chemotaxis protein